MIDKYSACLFPLSFLSLRLSFVLSPPFTRWSLVGFQCASHLGPRGAIGSRMDGLASILRIVPVGAPLHGVGC